MHSGFKGVPQTAAGCQANHWQAHARADVTSREARLELALRYVLLPGDHVPPRVVVVLRVLEHVRTRAAEVGSAFDGVIRMPVLRASSTIHKTLPTAFGADPAQTSNLTLHWVLAVSETVYVCLSGI